MYEKLIQTLIQEIIEPEEAVVLGGTWRVPVMEKLLTRSFIEDLKIDGTYNEASFSREYKQFVLFKLLRIAEKSLELYKLQHKNEISLSAIVLKII